MIQMEVKIYATNLSNKPRALTPENENEWTLNETNYVLTSSLICGMKTKHKT
jgi:hypothetical protein